MLKDVFMMLMSIIIVVLTVIIAVMVYITLSGCTLSFTNISTHGTATDLVDEEQTASPDVKSDLTIPMIP